MSKLLITGYSGFVGQHFVQMLKGSMFDVIGLGRSKPSNNDIAHFYADIDGDSDYSKSLISVDIVVHIAGRPQDDEDNGITCEDVNHKGTANLARQAKAAGVKRFIYISSVKVCGEQTLPGTPFNAIGNPDPIGSYAISKTKAEQAIQQIGYESGMEVVIIRPPLIYGANVKGNFNTLLELVYKELPFPLGKVTENMRSLVYVGNLCDLMYTCLQKAEAAGQILMVSDDHDISTADLLILLAKTMKKRSRLIGVPTHWLSAVAKIVGKEEAVNRLIGSLQIDINETKDRLAWEPKHSLESAIRETVESFLEAKEKKENDH